MPRLARILIYPLKSFDPVEVETASVLPSGSVEHDRRWALYNAAGELINGKRTPKLHPIRAAFDLQQPAVTLSAGGRSAAFHLVSDRARLEAWLDERLGDHVTVRENADAGFPDDSDSPGPTVVSTATLEEVAAWFDLPLDDVRLRFRANLEIDGVDPFWEDHLYGEQGAPVRFHIGSVVFEGTNPCQRCVVPTRSPRTGQRLPNFGQIFEERRFETLPYWATRSRFDHFFRLAVNTRLATAAGGIIRVGDDVSISGSASGRT